MYMQIWMYDDVIPCASPKFEVYLLAQWVLLSLLHAVVLVKVMLVHLHGAKPSMQVVDVVEASSQQTHRV